MSSRGEREVPRHRSPHSPIDRERDIYAVLSGRVQVGQSAGLGAQLMLRAGS